MSGHPYLAVPVLEWLRERVDNSLAGIKYGEAVSEIERLRADIAHRDELERFAAPLSCATHGLVPNLALFGNKCPACERDRLRAELGKLYRYVKNEPIMAGHSAWGECIHALLSTPQCQHDLLKPDTTIEVIDKWKAKCKVCIEFFDLPGRPERRGPFFGNEP